jgi:hypothetical protein
MCRAAAPVRWAQSALSPVLDAAPNQPWKRPPNTGAMPSFEGGCSCNPELATLVIGLEGAANLGSLLGGPLLHLQPTTTPGADTQAWTGWW